MRRKILRRRCVRLRLPLVARMNFVCPARSFYIVMFFVLRAFRSVCFFVGTVLLHRIAFHASAFRVMSFLTLTPAAAPFVGPCQRLTREHVNGNVGRFAPVLFHVSMFSNTSLT